MTATYSSPNGTRVRFSGSTICLHDVLNMKLSGSQITALLASLPLSETRRNSDVMVEMEDLRRSVIRLSRHLEDPSLLISVLHGADFEFLRKTSTVCAEQKKLAEKLQDVVVSVYSHNPIEEFATRYPQFTGLIKSISHMDPVAKLKQ
jgi:hypothetical protein